MCTAVFWHHLRAIDRRASALANLFPTLTRTGSIDSRRPSGVSPMRVDLLNPSLAGMFVPSADCSPDAGADAGVEPVDTCCVLNVKLLRVPPLVRLLSTCQSAATPLRTAHEPSKSRFKRENNFYIV